ncbi:MAG: hypothetical protein WC755_06520 [Candidatus Woesearchaeota archaeon]|jgi:adenylate kinase family enzyme
MLVMSIPVTKKQKYKKIHIVGIYGSGKSTLATDLSKLLNIKSYDLDEIKYKRKYDLIRPLKERLKIIKEISDKNAWITEGAWTNYALPLYKKADLVILLQIPEFVLYFRIMLRHFKRYFDGDKYEDHNIKTTFKIIRRVWQYYHDEKHFMALDVHKQYMTYTKEFTMVKNNSDLKKLIVKINSR